ESCPPGGDRWVSVGNLPEDGFRFRETALTVADGADHGGMEDLDALVVRAPAELEPCVRQPLRLLEAASERGESGAEKGNVPHVLGLAKLLRQVVVRVDLGSQSWRVTQLHEIAHSKSAPLERHLPIAGPLRDLDDLVGNREPLGGVCVPPGGDVPIIENGCERRRIARAAWLRARRGSGKGVKSKALASRARTRARRAPSASPRAPSASSRRRTSSSSTTPAVNSKPTPSAVRASSSGAGSSRASRAA